jgi:hypothetical protein
MLYPQRNHIRQLIDLSGFWSSRFEGRLHPRPPSQDGGSPSSRPAARQILVNG